MNHDDMIRDRGVPLLYVERVSRAVADLMLCEPEVETTHKRRLATALNALADWAGLVGGRVSVPGRPPESEER